MLNNIRNFAKTKSAGVLVAILIVPFVLWGMGGAFSGGNKNNIAKINNENISTEDFINYANTSRLDQNTIRENIENNIIEEILGSLISKTILDLEIQNHNFLISDKILNKKIKNDENFKDEDNKFSRTKYEKFLLSSQFSAVGYESRLREKELNEDLFTYISGGLKSPLFMVNTVYRNEKKKVFIDYINLTNIYKKKEDLSKAEIVKFIENNKESLKEKLITFKYSKIVPKNLIGITDFNNLFFEKIDDIENDIANNINFDEIIKKNNLDFKLEENYNFETSENNEEFYKKIYENSENKKIDLLDENDFYILYEVVKQQKILPDIKNNEFTEKVKEMMFNKNKFDFNNDLIKKIGEKKFTQSDFENISKNEILKIELNSIDDDAVFTSDSLKYLYTLGKNEYGLVSDVNNEIFLIRITDILYKNISKESENFSLYKKQSNEQIKNNIYSSYDVYINKKYKIKINENTLDRVKNYFR